MGTDTLSCGFPKQRAAEKGHCYHVPQPQACPTPECGNSPHCPLGPSKKTGQLFLMLPPPPGPFCTYKPPCAPPTPLPVRCKLQRAEPKTSLHITSPVIWGIAPDTYNQGVPISPAARFQMPSRPESRLMLAAAGMMEGAESRCPASPPWPSLIPRSAGSRLFPGNQPCSQM